MSHRATTGIAAIEGVKARAIASLVAAGSVVEMDGIIDSIPKQIQDAARSVTD
jgi:hypothetical protein